jgi:hypothetical protein
MSTKAQLHEKIAELTKEHLESVGGGLSCSTEEIVQITENIVTMYENMIDATSYMFERVLGP